MTASVGEDDLAGSAAENLSSCGATQSKNDALEMANRLREKMASPPVLPFNGDRFHVTLIGGLSFAPAEGTDWDTLFTAADERLYAAKNGGQEPS